MTPARAPRGFHPRLFTSFASGEELVPVGVPLVAVGEPSRDSIASAERTNVNSRGRQPTEQRGIEFSALEGPNK